MTSWAVVLIGGRLAAALSWRASRRAFEDGQWPPDAPHDDAVRHQVAR